MQWRPVIIQGGMGVGLSSWQLARAVSRTGSLGVVSGTALDTVLARRLQDGDADGAMRRAMSHFPHQGVVGEVLQRYFRPQGCVAGQGYRPVPKLTLNQRSEGQQLAVLANFVEVWLAKEGHPGRVGINFLEKVQMATPAAALGAVLAGVDYVLMGAGVPREIPRLLTDLANDGAGGVSVDVKGADRPWRVDVDAQSLLGLTPVARPRPQFLAIIASTMMAGYLARDEATRPDGYVIEGAVAGGHNAPPRGRLVLGEDDEPVYGERDEVDLGRVRDVELPFWLAGGYGTPAGLAHARSVGASGVQVGSLFALAEDSGLQSQLRTDLLGRVASGALTVRTDVQASPTGFPFKVAQIPGTLSEPELYEERQRLCDLSYLRTPYLSPDGTVGYRCPSEPAHLFVRKGGDVAQTVGRKCLCNALTANIGLGQTRRDGYAEQALITLGADLDGVTAIAAVYPSGWTATQAVQWLLAPAEVSRR